MTIDQFRSEIHGIIGEIAKKVHEHTLSILCGHQWSYSYLEDRFSSTNSGAGVSKFRIHLSDGTYISKHKAPYGVAGLLADAFEIRTEQLPKSEWWYGIYLKVYPDAQFDVEFEYDPDCISKMDITS